MAQIVVPALSDSVMEGIGASKDVNFGGQLYVYHRVTYLGGNKLGWGRAIGNFDVAALAGAEIISAKLVRSVFTITNPGKQAKLSRCAHPEWIESQVTWNSYRNNFRWTAEGGDHDDAGPPAAITYTEPSSAGDHEVLGLAPFVVDALTNRSGIVSIITRLANESPGVSTEYAWRSKEYGSSAWRLVIDYTPAAPTEAGHRSLDRTGFGSGARPARAAQPAQPTAGTRPAQPS